MNIKHLKRWERWTIILGSWLLLTILAFAIWGGFDQLQRSIATFAVISSVIAIDLVFCNFIAPKFNFLKHTSIIRFIIGLITLSIIYSLAYLPVHSLSVSDFLDRFSPAIGMAIGLLIVEILLNPYKKN